MPVRVRQTALTPELGQTRYLCPTLGQKRVDGRRRTSKRLYGYTVLGVRQGARYCMPIQLFICLPANKPAHGKGLGVDARVHGRTFPDRVRGKDFWEEPGPGT